MQSTASRKNALVGALAVGTLFQIGMVVLGHYAASVQLYFGAGGMLFSLLAGVAFGLRTPLRGTALDWLRDGVIAGGGCGFLGIAVSVLLGDVPLSLLAFGTLGSAVAGAVGAVAVWSARRRAVVST